MASCSGLIDGLGQTSTRWPLAGSPLDKVADCKWTCTLLLSVCSCHRRWWSTLSLPPPSLAPSSRRYSNLPNPSFLLWSKCIADTWVPSPWPPDFQTQEWSVSTDSGVEGLRKKDKMGRKTQQEAGLTPFDSSCLRITTRCQQYLLGFALLYFYIHMPSHLQLSQCRHRNDSLWPGMTSNGMLKYAHCSKYSPSVSRLQLFLVSGLLCLVVSFGFCSHFQSQKKRVRVVFLNFSCRVEPCYRCWNKQ